MPANWRWKGCLNLNTAGNTAGNTTCDRIYRGISRRYKWCGLSLSGWKIKSPAQDPPFLALCGEKNPAIQNILFWYMLNCAWIQTCIHIYTCVHTGLSVCLLCHSLLSFCTSVVLYQTRMTCQLPFHNARKYSSHFGLFSYLCCPHPISNSQPNLSTSL